MDERPGASLEKSWVDGNNGFHFPLAEDSEMSEAIWELLDLGSDREAPAAVAMALRTAVVYAFTLVLVRLGSRRLLAKPSAFDLIVAIMVGSIMSRAINGEAPFAPTLVAGAVLLFMHWAFAALALRMHWLSVALKGTRIALIRDGKVLPEGMRSASITDDDLAEALRLQVHDEDPASVAVAYMERSGAISVIPRKR
jgi:uncharacterized membrane protein YcaP (DUF421 family)